MTPAVYAEALVKRYEDMPRNAVDGLSFAIPPGAVVGLLGPNGAGKTTLTKLVCGATIPTSGRITVFGGDLSAHGGQAKRDVGVVHQSAPFDMMLSVRDNLRIAAAFKGLRWREVRTTVDDLIDAFTLRDSVTQLVFTLSGGERRRLQVIRALLGRPRLLLLDEPSAGMDVSGRRKMWDLLRDLRAQHGTTVLWTSHYVEELERNCERVLIVHHGRLLEQGTPRDLAARFGGQTALVRPGPGCLDREAALAAAAGRAERAGLRAVRTEELVQVSGPSLRDRLPHALAAPQDAAGAEMSVEFQAPSLEDAFLNLLEDRGEH